MNTMNNTGYAGQDSFIKNLIYAPTIEKERNLIADALADMRTKIRTCDDKTLCLIIARLIFLNIRGENTAFGQVEVLKLMSHPQYSFKRIGYLAAGQLLDASNEISILLPQTVVKDLESTSPVNQSLALTLVSNMISPELCRAASPSIVHLLQSSNTSVQKRAAMAAISCIRCDHDQLETFRPSVASLLNSSSHGIVSSGINLALEMLNQKPELTSSWKGFVIPFVRILKTLYEVRGGREFEFGGMNDPFLQIRILKCLGALKNSSSELDDLLTNIITGLDCRRNTSRGILLQAVEAISSCSKKPSLRSLAINQIGRLFTYQTPLVYYTALSAFSRFLFTNGGVIDRESADSQALQRYKAQIVQCLDHPDPSIRRRALDVISALINADNVTILFPEIMSYMRLCDTDFKGEVVPKLFAAIQRFAPSFEWNFDAVLKLMTDCESYISADIIVTFCRTIASNKEHRNEIAKQLANLLETFSTNQPIVQVSSWVAGEFLNDNIGKTAENLKTILSLPQCSVETRCYIVTALSKLAARFGMQQEIGPIIVQLQSANSIELQQRAGEMVRILSKPQLAAQILAPEEIQTANEVKTEKHKAKHKEEPLIENDEKKPLIDVIEDKKPLIDEKKPQTTVKEERKPQGAVEALRTDDYVVYFEIKKNAENGNQIAIRSSIYGLGNVLLTNFRMQFGVPAGWVLAAKQPSGDQLSNAGPPIQQVILLENRGVIPLVMRTQTSYMYGSQPIKEMGQINPIF